MVICSHAKLRYFESHEFPAPNSRSLGLTNLHPCASTTGNKDKRINGTVGQFFSVVLVTWPRHGSLRPETNSQYCNPLEKYGVCI